MIDDTANDQSSKKPDCKPFHQSFTGSAQDLINKAQKEITKNGGTFNGNTSSGSFSVKKIKGNYTISGQKITITIIDQDVYPCSLIHDYIKAHIH
jgi:hypothetical protein